MDEAHRESGSFISFLLRADALYFNMNYGNPFSSVLSISLFILVVVTTPSTCLADDSLRFNVLQTMEKATRFFRAEVSTKGGYLWQYSEDLSLREGERKANASTIWVQPPGTPAVGEAFLVAYQVTGQAIYLDAALDAGYALEWGQLESGGWDYRIDFDSSNPRRYHYRRDFESGKPAPRKPRNISTLDDNVTQSALLFLMRLDQALEFNNPRIRHAIDYCLEHLLNAQYPNGAWPQQYYRFYDPSRHTVSQARYPESWLRNYTKENYREYYTFNDNTINDVVVTLLEAHRIYKRDNLRRAAERAGDFIILAQMPEPQPVWAQQYNLNMEPAWARRFEPPSISGLESQNVIATLLMLYRETGNERFLQPLPAAFAWLERSQLADGRIARFYELKTNRPLYFSKDYRLVYTDDDLPTHYAFKVRSRIERLEREYERLKATDYAVILAEKNRGPANKPLSIKKLERDVQGIVSALDEQGRWVEEGELRYQPIGDQLISSKVISTRTFIRNIRTLANYVAASQSTE